MQGKDRISVEKQKQIELLLAKGHSIRKISEALKMCRRTVRRYAKRIQTPKSIKAKEEPARTALFEPDVDWAKKLDWSEIVEESCRGVPVKTLYEESGVEDVKYWAFWNMLKKAKSQLKPVLPETTLKLAHKPGEKAQIDYCDGLPLTDPETGEVTKTQLFVVTLPFSSLIYAEFSLNQKLTSFIRSHENAWKSIGGVPQYTVPDNLKSAVTRADIYDPDVNKTFSDFANHCGFAVLPAKPLTPKHKASVESAVGLLQRTFYPKVRKQTFVNIRELNVLLKRHVSELNDQIMKEHGASRNERFELEKQHLQPLPDTDFEFTQWKTLKVHPDCHIQCCRSFYSVPWLHVGKEVRVKITDSLIEVFDTVTLEKIAMHPRSKRDYKRVTCDEHYPPEKVATATFSVEVAKRQARQVGPNFSALLNELFSHDKPLRYLRAVQGWLRLKQSQRHTVRAIEYAAEMALKHNKYDSKYFKACLSHFDRKGPDIKSNVSHLCPKRNNHHSFLHKDN